jgi:hypothetical protein
LVTKIWLASLAAVTLALGGCEYFNAAAGVEPPPAEGRPFPNLASVPTPPPVGPAAERRAEVDRLMAARDTSLREDQELRAIDPGRALPPPRPRAAPPARPAAPGAAPAEPAQPDTAAPAETPPEPPRAAVTVPRPQLSSSLFMGTVVQTGERGPLADFQRKVLQDSVAMAQRNNGRIRLVGGRSEEERQAIANELVGLGIAAGRISAAPDRADANRAGIDVLVEN